MRIVILHRGWVVVGKYSETPTHGNLTSAYVVRHWGTTKGLGELAEKGPTSSTTLDPTPEQEFPLTAVINTMKCNAKAWEKWARNEVNDE